MTQLDIDIERPLPAQHETQLRTALRLQDNAPIPKTLLSSYWRFEHFARIIGVSMSPELMVLAAAVSLSVEPDSPESFLDVIDRDGLRPGARVVALYKRKWQWGRFQKINPKAKQVYVIFDSEEGQLRPITPTLVRRPTLDETDAINEHE